MYCPLQKKGGENTPTVQEMQPFADCLGGCGLVDMRSRWRTFTWTNNTICSKIDRVLVNEALVDSYPEVELWFKEEGLSDHTRLIITMSNQPRKRAHCFKFCNMWGKDTQFLPIVDPEWQRQCQGDLMFQFMCKLRSLQKALSPLCKKYSDVM